MPRCLHSVSVMRQLLLLNVLVKGITAFVTRLLWIIGLNTFALLLTTSRERVARLHRAVTLMWGQRQCWFNLKCRRDKPDVSQACGSGPRVGRVDRDVGCIWHVNSLQLDLNDETKQTVYLSVWNVTLYKHCVSIDKFNIRMECQYKKQYLR